MQQSSKLRVAWLCHSGIAISETFLSATVDILGTMGPFIGVSGASAAMPCSSRIIPTGFAAIRETVAEKAVRRVFGCPSHMRRVQRRCRNRCLPILRDFSPDVVWVDYATTAVIADQMLLKLGKPFVIAVHGYDVTGSFNDFHYTAAFSEVAARASAVVCASDHIRRLVILAGVAPAKPHVIRLGLDATQITPDPHIQKTPWPSYIHLGRLTEQKHPIATLHAFARVQHELPNARLTFIGDGPLRARLESEISRLNVTEAVTLLGALPHREALSIVQQHWVFCQHSVTGLNGCQEGFAISPAEAALLELPVVSTLHNGIPEHVIDGQTGFLVREFDYETMADRMLVLAADSELRTAMGHRGRLNITDLCSVDSRSAALNALLNSVVHADQVARVQES